jgi:hypothetical protein
MARTQKRKVTTRKCQQHKNPATKRTKRVLAGGSLWSALGKVGNGLRRIGRTFKSVEGKFKYNTAHSGLIINNTPLSNKPNKNNDKSPFKVYYVRNLDKNQTVLEATKLNVNSLPTIEKLSEHTNTNNKRTLTYQNIPVLKKYYDAGYLGYLYKVLHNQDQSTLYMLYNDVKHNATNLELNNDYRVEDLLNLYPKLRILVVISDEVSSHRSPDANQPKSLVSPDKNIIPFTLKHSGTSVPRHSEAQPEGWAYNRVSTVSLTKRLTACLDEKQDIRERVGLALYNKRLYMSVVDSDIVNLNSRPFISHTDIMQTKPTEGISELGQGSGINYPTLILSNIHGCNSQIYNNDNGPNQLSNQNSERITELNMQLGILYSNDKGQKTILYTQNNELKEMPLSKFAEMATTEKPVKYVLVSRL